MQYNQIYVRKEDISQKKPFLYGMFLGMVGCVGLMIGLLGFAVMSRTNFELAHYYYNQPECRMVYTMGIKDNGHVGFTWQMRCK